MKKIIVSILLITGLIVPVYASDWSNPNPRQLTDLAGPLLLKHETNWGLMFANTTGYLNLLKDNFAGSVAPANPSTGQGWYDTSVAIPMLRLYNGSGWTGVFGGDIVSTGTSSFTGSVITTGTNTHSGVNNFTGGIVSTQTFSHTGGLPVSTVTGTAGYTITAANMGSTLIANLSSAATFTLPAASAVPVGSGLITKVTGSTITLAGTVEGVVNPTLGQNDEIKIWSNGTAWYGKKLSQTAAANAVPVSLSSGYLDSLWTHGTLLSTQTLTTGTTYTPTTGTTTIVVELIGGGGNGGNNVSGGISGAGGGGGGAYSLKRFTGISGTYSYAIGTAGVTTSFTGPGAVQVTAPGGSAGAANTTAAAPSVYAGGSGGGAGANADFTQPGSPGGVGAALDTAVGMSGHGGSSGRGGSGGAGVAATIYSSGQAASGYGGGGSGAVGNGTANPRSGGAGAPGVIIVWEFR